MSYGQHEDQHISSAILMVIRQVSIIRHSHEAQTKHERPCIVKLMASLNLVMPHRCTHSQLPHAYVLLERFWLKVFVSSRHSCCVRLVTSPVSCSADFLHGGLYLCVYITSVCWLVLPSFKHRGCSL